MVTNVAQRSETTPPNIAVVAGNIITAPPQGLYIPTNAMSVLLTGFEGPLDLLLYLVKHNDISIMDINVAEVCQQYNQYLEWMEELPMEVAAEYLTMAATLAEIKSCTLLPQSQWDDDEEENDPRAQLIQRLLEYERTVCAARYLETLPREDRDLFPAILAVPRYQPVQTLPALTLTELEQAFCDALRRVKQQSPHHVRKESLSVENHMKRAMTLLERFEKVSFIDLCSPEEGRLGVVTTFLAVLELLKQSLINLVAQKNNNSETLVITSIHRVH